jgi:uncharacterized protein YhbP (UPF0306 family)
MTTTQLDQLLPQISDLLQLPAMTLATCGNDGEPHAAAVYFASGDDLHLYFFSDPHSQHAQDLACNPRAAVSFYPFTSDWQDIRGLQMHGEVLQVEPGSQWQVGWQIYSAKFPFVIGLEALVAQNMLYVFIPGWVRLVDNRRSFGFKQEWTFP